LAKAMMAIVRDNDGNCKREREGGREREREGKKDVGINATWRLDFFF
jgi:hypothetical protein